MDGRARLRNSVVVDEPPVDPVDQLQVATRGSSLRNAHGRDEDGGVGGRKVVDQPPVDQDQPLPQPQATGMTSRNAQGLSLSLSLRYQVTKMRKVN